MSNIQRVLKTFRTAANYGINMDCDISATRKVAKLIFQLLRGWRRRGDRGQCQLKRLALKCILG